MGPKCAVEEMILSSLLVITILTLKTKITLHPFLFMTKIYTMLPIADVGLELRKKLLEENFYFVKFF